MNGRMNADIMILKVFKWPLMHLSLVGIASE
jgi:hypothetical protein